ncbi:MAG: hypothetical protein CVT96_06325 [Bacteroidetes bacterium HGW-Bacteroidetes-13]|nr:MAG: hypothetical protein CVT96_06325 [Bacteroidetes bacterium HGW-Bacteroidetes-13]
MNLFNKIFDFYIRSSLHVALAITCLSAITFLNRGEDINLNLTIFIFSTAVLAYNFAKYATLPFAILRKQKAVLIISFFSAITAIALVFSLPIKLFWWSLFFSMLTLLYSFPARPNIKNFRNRFGVKAYLIAICWSGICVGLPLLYLDVDFDFRILSDLVEIILFVLIWLIPFDIRDMDTDDKDLGTIPMILGVRKTKIAGSILLSIIVISTLIKNGLAWNSIYLICLLSAFFLWKAQKKQSKYFSSFWVESIPIVWFLIECVNNLRG